jgi:hypothetical protein
MTESISEIDGDYPPMGRGQTQFKSIAGRRYVHSDAFHILRPDALVKLAAAEHLAQAERGQRFNVARFDSSSDRISLLNYPAFFEDAFPALRESWQVDLGSNHVGYRTYQNSFNPPVPHRKELMLADDHPRRGEFEALTKMAESIGLFKDPTRIGFREQWIGLVRETGYRIVGHEFVPIANDETAEGLHEAPSDDRSAHHLHTMEMMLACTSIIWGGVVERHPKLRIGFLESGGGWVAPWLDWMDRHFDDQGFNDCGLKTKPSELFQRNCWISFEPVEGSIKVLADYIGPHKIL